MLLDLPNGALLSCTIFCANKFADAGANCSISAGNHLSAWHGLTILTGMMSVNSIDDWSGEDLH